MYFKSHIWRCIRALGALGDLRAPLGHPQKVSKNRPYGQKSVFLDNLFSSFKTFLLAHILMVS